jgi:hypothetical protein
MIGMKFTPRYPGVLLPCRAMLEIEYVKRMKNPNAPEQPRSDSLKEWRSK